MRIKTLGVALAVLASAACATSQLQIAPSAPGYELPVAVRTVLVTSPQAFREAVTAARPGDRIVLENGIWLDFDMVVDARGTAEAPIVVAAQNPGSVILSGQSSLRIAGEHVVVAGLVFRDGYTPRAEVISFRRDSKNLAFNSRVTQTVIENYNNPDRSQRDIWVVMYGQNNVFDHNHLSGKLNSGPTMAVRLNTPESQNNAHIIAHNYFGPRPVFGSNGGETLRIGTSHYSLTNSNTLVENNYFDRCSGEVEIISNKSGGNTYRGNTFFRSRGTLTLRHGNGTLVEGNLFDGDGAPYTGGVRVINADQTVRNNRFSNLTGERFSGALVVMNGVPNSPINRYHQVDGAVIEGNVFDTVTAIELGEGSDSERSAVPINSVFEDNIVLGADGVSPFRLHDDMSGIAFTGNVAAEAPPAALAAGFAVNDVSSSPPMDVGVARDATGVAWYPKPAMTTPFDGGRDIAVSPGPDALSMAMATAEHGDRLVLAPGTYSESKIMNVRIGVSIVAADTDGDAAVPGPVISFERPNLFLLSGNGALRLSGLTVTGANAPDASGNSFIATTALGGGGNHVVELSDMDFVDFDVNRGFSVVEAAKGTFYDRVAVRNSRFSDISGTVFKFDAETDDFGIYSVEYLTIDDSQFTNIGGPVASVYRGGRDESTFGPHVWVTGSAFDGVGTRGQAPAMVLHGVQNMDITGNTFAHANPVAFTITTGKPKTVVTDNVVAAGMTGDVVSTKDVRAAK